MAKLMEVIEKNPNFKTGTASLKLLDTTFTQLTRKIGGNSGANFKTAKAGDILSKEILTSLNQEQLLLKDKVILWQNAYNNWIDSIKSKVTTAEHFNYTFSSLIDYSSKYIPGTTLADYYLLTEFINAEKELYEFGHYWGKNHMLDLLFKMKEWSKTQVYGSSVQEIGAEYEVFSEASHWYISDNAGLNVWTNLGGGTHDKCWYYVSDLQKIKVGETKVIKGTVSSYSRPGEIYLQITRNSLNNDSNDDGYYTFSAWGKYIDKVRTWPTVTKWTNTGSPHFDNDNPTLPWLKSRILL